VAPILKCRERPRKRLLMCSLPSLAQITRKHALTCVVVTHFSRATRSFGTVADESGRFCIARSCEPVLPQQPAPSAHFLANEQQCGRSTMASRGPGAPGTGGPRRTSSMRSRFGGEWCVVV
jgi:hypothetical protein